MKLSPILCAVAVAAAARASSGQDTRTVTEPVIPAACTTLNAQLATAGKGHSGMTLAPADEQKLDTDRIQKAIDHCGKGKAVVLAVDGGNNAFLTGPIELREGVTLVLGDGVTLFGSRDAALYATSPGSCGIVNDSRGGCKPLIAVKSAPHSGIMGNGTLDGRGGEVILGKKESWWDLAEDARKGGAQQCPRLIVADHSDDFTLYNITIKNSPNFHVTYNGGNGFTVWGVKLDTPQRLARNTDGIDPGGGSKNITITHSFIRAGDDNVAIKGGSGGISQITIAHNHFYWGHGMSIGSETYGGVSKMLVQDLSLEGDDAAIRIKSNGERGGLTQGVVYDDICIRDSREPISLDTGYAHTTGGDRPPVMKDVTLHNVRISGGGKILFNGFDKTHRIAVNLDNVLITDAGKYTYSLNFADIHLGPGPVNLQLTSGNDSTLGGSAPKSGKPESCDAKFVPFPTN